MLKKFILLSLLTTGFVSHALTLKDIQGTWTRYAFRCAGAAENDTYPMPGTDIRLTIRGNKITSQSRIGDLGWAKTSALLSVKSKGDLLALKLTHVVQRPVVSGKSESYDFLDDKVAMPLTLALTGDFYTNTLVLGNIRDGVNCDGRPYEFLYAK